MEDAQFVTRLKAKLELITDRDVELRVKEDDPNCLEVDLNSLVPQVVLGRNIYDYPGFARMWPGIRPQGRSSKVDTWVSWSSICCWRATSGHRESTALAWMIDW